MKIIITKTQAKKILNNIPKGCSIKISVADANRILADEVNSENSKT